MHSYLQILGVGEGRRRTAPPVAARPAAPGGPVTPRPPGRHVTQWERDQLARLPSPAPSATMADDPTAYAMALAAAEDGGEALEPPPLVIKTQGRPGILLSSFPPPSGPAKSPEGRTL